MTQAAPQTATEARAALDARIADKEFGARVLAGEIAANAEMVELTTKIAAGGDDVMTAAMNGSAADEEQRMMAGITDMFRAAGIRDEVTREFLSGKPVSKEEFRLVEGWKASRMKDAAFVEKFMSGDAEAVRLMLTANSVLAKGPPPEVAA